SHVHLRLGNPPQHQRRQLMHLAARNIDVVSVAPHVRNHPLYWTQFVRLCSIFVAQHAPMRAKELSIGYINERYCFVIGRGDSFPTDFDGCYVTTTLPGRACIFSDAGVCSPQTRSFCALYKCSYRTLIRGAGTRGGPETHLSVP